MAIRSEALGRDLSKAEEKEADINKDGTVSKEELKGFEEKHAPNKSDAAGGGMQPNGPIQDRQSPPAA